jgi:transposase
MYLLDMAIRPEALPTDAAVLTEMVLALDAENEKLRVAMQTLKEMIFGKRSERFAVIVAEQLALELDDLATGVMPPAPANDDAPATKPPARPRQKARRNIGALPKHLPRCEQVIEPDTTACPCCAGRLHKIGEDVSEVLDVIPAILRVLRTIRPKYACRGCTDGVVQAKVLPRLIESGMASTALVSHVVVSKFAWYLPLYRQVQILAGQGIHLDRATLAGWVKRAAWWLMSLYELQLRTIQASPRLFCDETPMPVLDPGRHRTRICQFWAHAMDDRPWGGPSPPAVAYVFADGRGTDKIAAQLTGFSGILQVDGYAAYKALARGHGGAIRLAFCLAHARRKFVEVYKTTQSPFAHEVIERLQAVYAIEAEIRGSSAEQRLAARRTRTAPLMEALKARLTSMLGQLFSQSPLAGAINYALNHWDGLTLFLSDGRIEVDTNTVERSMRPIAMGRRNSLFSGSEGGAESWAILASLVNTAKLHELDPQAYLADVLERIVSGRTKSHQLHELLAWNWKAARQRSAQAAGADGARWRRHRAPSAPAAMPLDELERWLQARAERRPGATSIATLDGYVAAIVAGPVSISPLDWICPLLAIDADAFNHGGTPEFAAISAVVQRHNDVSNTLSMAPQLFKPIFRSKPGGGVDVRPWCHGFYAAMKLRLLAWSPLLSFDNPDYHLLLPVLLFCTDDHGRPVVPGADTAVVKRLRHQAPDDIPAFVEGIRQYWMPTRYKRAT